MQLILTWGYWVRGETSPLGSQYGFGNKNHKFNTDKQKSIVKKIQPNNDGTVFKCYFLQ